MRIDHIHMFLESSTILISLDVRVKFGQLVEKQTSRVKMVICRDGKLQNVLADFRFFGLPSDYELVASFLNFQYHA